MWLTLSRMLGLGGSVEKTVSGCLVGNAILDSRYSIDGRRQDRCQLHAYHRTKSPTRRAAARASGKCCHIPSFGARAMDVQLFMLRLQRRGQRTVTTCSFKVAAKNFAYVASMSAVASSRVFGSATLCAAQTDNSLSYRTSSWTGQGPASQSGQQPNDCNALIEVAGCCAREERRDS
jgi:hypothetical protein